MAEQIIVKANAYRDGAGNRPLPRLIGPFPDRETANAYMYSQQPLWGTWNTAPIFTPEVTP